MSDPDYLKQEDWIRGVIKDAQIQDLKILDVYNKTDVADPKLHGSWIQERALSISAKSGLGIEALKKTLLNLAGLQTTNSEGQYVARQRHLDALRRVQANVLTATQWIEHVAPQLELIAEELRLAQMSLSEITGEFSSEDLLGEIFAGFCIGK